MVGATIEEGCNRGVLFGLIRAWPTSIGSGHDKTKAEEDIGDVAEEETNIGGAVEL